MICPKCGFEQPDGPECMRCGIVVSRYKGPVLGTVPVIAAAPLPPPPPPMESVGTVYGDPAPALAVAGGGTLYGGPPPAEAGGGTVYGGPGSAPAAVSGRVPGRFEIGKILSETFAVYFANFIPFAILTGLALSPLFLLQAYIADADKAPPAAGLSAIPLLFANLLCPQIATAAITYGVFQQMRGRDTSIGECLKLGLSSLRPVLGLALLQGLCIGVAALLCLVPGILLWVRWAVSVPAVVEERPGVGGAMDRSTFLTEGYRWEIFGVLFVLVVLGFGAGFVAGLVSAGNPTLLQVLGGIISLLGTGLSATATSVMYYRLRSIKESIDVDQISSVFA